MSKKQLKPCEHDFIKNNCVIEIKQLRKYTPSTILETFVQKKRKFAINSYGFSWNHHHSWSPKPVKLIQKKKTCFLLCSWTANLARLSISTLFWKPLQSLGSPGILILSKFNCLPWPKSKQYPQPRTKTLNNNAETLSITIFAASLSLSLLKKFASKGICLVFPLVTGWCNDLIWRKLSVRSGPRKIK